MEVKAGTSLQLGEYLLDFGIFEDGLDLWIVVDRLHDGVILHFLFLLFLFPVSDLLKVVPRQRTKLHQELPELRVLSILLHSLLRLIAHLLEHLHGCRVLKGRHEPGTLHNFLHEVGREPLILCLLQASL